MKWTAILASALLFSLGLEGTYIARSGASVQLGNAPDFSLETHYALGAAAYEEEDFKEAIYHFNIISLNFPNTECCYEAKFFLGIAYFYDEEYEFANEALTDYLNCQSSPRYFEEAICYKLQIADCLRLGAKKHYFGTKVLPKWACGRGLAVEVYDEVILALPCHDFSAHALYAKGYIHWENQNFKESIDSFQMLIRRFPKHELAPASYLCISAVYLDQAETEFQNPDLLALCEINVKKFERDFPKDETICEAAAAVQMIKELYARGLWETGQFYERIDQPQASAIYYASAIRQFPDTAFASCCRYRLSVVAASCEGIELCEEFCL